MGLGRSWEFVCIYMMAGRAKLLRRGTRPLTTVRGLEFYTEATQFDEDKLRSNMGAIG
jgi:hypothetical protein